MSFKLGNFHTDNIHGFSAILHSVPSLPVSTSISSFPGSDGGYFHGSRMQSTVWDFSLRLRDSTVHGVLAKADVISRALNPNVYGLQDFTPQALEPWVWQGVVSGGVAWERDDVLWLNGIAQLNGHLSIATPDPYGKAKLNPVTLSGPGTLHLQDIGNAPHRPTFIITGSATPQQAFNIEVGGQLTSVFGGLNAGEELVLDYENLDFYIQDTGATYRRNVAEEITPFQRFNIQGPVAVEVYTTGATIESVTAHVTSRRI